MQGRSEHHRCEQELFAWVPEPLAAIASKCSVSARPVHARELGLQRLPAVTRWGLPYAIDASLWRVCPADPATLTPFEEQRQHCTGPSVPDREQQHVLTRFTIEGPVRGWTPVVAERFAALTEARFRARLAEALVDGSLVVERAGGPLQVSGDGSDDSTFELLGSLVALWRHVSFVRLSADPVRIVRATASASALARELSARRYVSALGSLSSPPRGASLLEARRWQASVLWDLLEEAETVPTIVDRGPTEVDAEEHRVA
jgi:hypothetical protein